MRIWDYFSSQRPDQYLANSEYIAKRIEKYYRKNAKVLRPPVDFERFSKGIKEEKQDFFIAIGRLIPYKKFDLLIETFNNFPQKKLKIVGRGPELEYLKTLAKDSKNIEFLGFVSDEELPKLLGQAQAFLFPQNEDAGIAPMEALSAGTPVIAFKKGGAIGIIEDKKNGVFFEEQTKESLFHAIQTFEFQKDWDREAISQNMKRFSKENYATQFLKEVEVFLKKNSITDW